MTVVIHVFPPVVSHELLYVRETVLRRKTLPRLRSRSRRNIRRRKGKKAVGIK